MTDVVERYLTLGLALGRHVDGLVDSYYGPSELAEAVNAAPPVDAAELAAQADALAADVSSAPGLDAQRRGWLSDQILGLATYAHVLAGDSLSYTDEVEQCYGIRPHLGSEAAYSEAHEELEDLLPGVGPLHERYETYRREHAVEPARMVPALHALIAVLRLRTATLVALPDGEQLVVEEVHDEPWWAFNYYLGDLRSRVVVNSDSRRQRPTSLRSRRTRHTRVTTRTASSRSTCSCAGSATWRSRSSSCPRRSRSLARASPSSASRS